jgi:hypothetical protein
VGPRDRHFTADFDVAVRSSGPSCPARAPHGWAARIVEAPPPANLADPRRRARRSTGARQVEGAYGSTSGVAIITYSARSSRILSRTSTSIGRATSMSTARRALPSSSPSSRRCSSRNRNRSNADTRSSTSSSRSSTARILRHARTCRRQEGRRRSAGSSTGRRPRGFPRQHPRGLEGAGTSGYRGKYPRIDLSSRLLANSWNSAMVAQILDSDGGECETLRRHGVRLAATAATFVTNSVRLNQFGLGGSVASRFVS